MYKCGSIPRFGLLKTKSLFFILSPGVKSLAAWILLLPIFLFCISEKSTFFLKDPRDFSVLRMNSTKLISSFGSKAKWWSGPFEFLFKVICFSITFAPSETAIADVKFSILWSDKPIL